MSSEVFLSGANEAKELKLMSRDKPCYVSTESPGGTRRREREDLGKSVEEGQA